MSFFGGPNPFAGGNMPGLPELTGSPQLQGIIKELAGGQGVAQGLAQQAAPEIAMAQTQLSVPDPSAIIGQNTGQSNALMDQLMRFL